MEIIPDPIQVVLYAIPFLVTILAMNRIIFQPMIAYIEDRVGAIEGGRREAEALQDRCTERMADYEQQMEQARGEIGSLRNERRSEAITAYNEIVEGARNEADVRIAGALEEIGAARDAARSGLQGVSDELAGRIASQVLGRPVAAK